MTKITSKFKKSLGNCSQDSCVEIGEDGIQSKDSD